MDNWKNEHLYHAWYQGCKGEVPEGGLTHLETCGSRFVAEPKRDGIWCAAFGNADGVRFFSRTVEEKQYSLGECVELKGVALFGELGYGSQESRRRRVKLGRDFMDVFELGAIDYDFSVLRESGAQRRRLLVNWWRKQSRYVKDHFIVVPRWRQLFQHRYDMEPEGLVLKNLDADEGYVGDGEKVAWWLKAKKEHTVDLVILDWEPSTAELKCADGRPRVKRLICGAYVGNELKPLVKVGSMKDGLSVAIAADFDSYRGKVIALRHSGQFKSGALRHPKVDPTLDEPVRTDKLPTDCRFEIEQ